MVVWCLQHSDRVRPAGVADWAADRGVELRVVRIDRGDPLPPARDVTSAVVLGGEMNTDETPRHPWLDIERDWLSRLLDVGNARVFGICLGSQLLAEVLGASVGRGPAFELGWHGVETTPGGRTSWLADALPTTRTDVFQWHGDTWTLPPGATLLLRGTGGTVESQAFAWDDRVVGVQFHPEFTRAYTQRLADTSNIDPSRSELVQTPSDFLMQADFFAAMRELRDRLLDSVLLPSSDR